MNFTQTYLKRSLSLSRIFYFLWAIIPFDLDLEFLEEGKTKEFADKIHKKINESIDLWFSQMESKKPAIVEKFREYELDSKTTLILGDTIQ